ncbi:hypothetical protein NBRC116495_35970 [Aurantivibrio plasticivorans]
MMFGVAIGSTLLLTEHVWQAAIAACLLTKIKPLHTFRTLLLARYIYFARFLITRMRKGNSFILQTYSSYLGSANLFFEVAI